LARLFVYQRNVERVAGTVEAVVLELKTALTRELQSTLEDDDEPGRARA